MANEVFILVREGSGYYDVIGKFTDPKYIGMVSNKFSVDELSGICSIDAELEKWYEACNGLCKYEFNYCIDTGDLSPDPRNFGKKIFFMEENQRDIDEGASRISYVVAADIKYAIFFVYARNVDEAYSKANEIVERIENAK